ncbi:hypothetical protein T4E_6506 [Trichinella pseudospiralis]|uniref:Uncharacterized protein n=1 Tax=Trichinella pseudospiralis TaxID=6337 RepID=A0A0V0WP34_TRIPS|nr:hypothetical protein T4E_6506 [Trichinella pseudospiralis]
MILDKPKLVLERQRFQHCENERTVSFQGKHCTVSYLNIRIEIMTGHLLQDNGIWPGKTGPQKLGENLLKCQNATLLRTREG